MNKVLIFLTFFLFCARFLPADEPLQKVSSSVEVEIKEHPLPFQVYYKLEDASGQIGEIIKEKMEIWTHYNYYGNYHPLDFIAEAYVRLFSLEKYFIWSSVIDIYAASGHALGSIEGCWLTFYRSKYEFYDDSRQLLGIAYFINKEKTFILVSPQDEQTILARYAPGVNAEGLRNWKLTIYNKEAIPSTFLYIFGAFIVDHQDQFE